MPAGSLSTFRPTSGQGQIQTLRQVLKLVHNASVGLPTTSRAAALWARGYSGIASVSVGGGATVLAAAGSGGARAGQQIILRRQTSHAAQTQNHPKGRDLTRAYGAAATASADSPSLNHDSNPELSTSSASRQRPHADRETPSSFTRRARSRSIPPKSSTNKLIPSSLAGKMRLPSPLYQRLTRYDITPAEFRDAFSERGLQPGDLGHVYALQAVWGVWLGSANTPVEQAKRTGTGIGTGADPSLWAWLAGQLGHLLHDDVNQDVRALAQAMRGHALVQLGQKQEALAALEAGMQGASRSPLALAIRSLTYTGLSEGKGDRAARERHKEEADRAAVLALRRTCDGDYLVPEQLDATIARVLEQFGQSEGEGGGAGGVVAGRRSMEEAVGLIRDVGRLVRSRVLSHEDGGQSVFSGVRKVVQRVMDALVRLEEPCEWLEDEMSLGAGREHGQEQAQGSGASQNTRWMASLLLCAHLRTSRSNADPISTDCIQDILGFIQQHQLPLPASLHIEALVALANAKEVPSGAVEIANLVRKHADDLSHARLSGVLQLAARKSMRELGILAWDVIEWRFSPLPSDRHRAALLGLADDVDVLKGRIERTIGSLDHPDALDVLMRKYILSNDISSAQTTFDRLINIRPTRVAYDRMLAFYAAHARADDAIELFDTMLSRGIQPTLASLTSLVALFANRRDVENAQNVFDMITAMGFTADAAAWTAILNAEVEAGEWTAAAYRWQGMPDRLKTSRSVVGVVLKAYVHLATPTAKVMEIFESVREEDKSAHMWSLVIQSAVDDRDFPLAEDLFERMRAAHAADASKPSPSVFHYSILLYGYMQADQQARAKEVYDAMLERGIIPTSVTYGMMLSSWRHADGATAFAQASQFARSVHLHAVQRAEAPRSRGEAMENIYGPLISLSGNIGDMETAEGYLKLAATPAYTAAGKEKGQLGPTGQEGFAGVAELSSMTAQDVEAHYASDRPAQALSMYTRLLDAYRHSGQTDSVMAIWEHIFALACRVSKKKASEHLKGVTWRRSQDNILCIPLSIVLDSLGAAGRLMDVRNTWERVSKAGFGFDAQNYNHYAVALARTGDVERAFAVVEDVLYPRWRTVVRRRTRALREAARLEQAYDDAIADRGSRAAQADLDGSSERAPRAAPENMTRIALEEGNTLNKSDQTTQPAQRPPNRRSEHRYTGAGAPSDSSDNSYSDPYTSSSSNQNQSRDGSPNFDVTMLKAWRTTDILWRPSVTTISVLEQVWKQLQEAKSRAWFVLADGGGEGDADEEGQARSQSATIQEGGMEGGRAVVTLPNFGDVPVRDAKGEISKSSPTAIIMRLNKRYVKTVALIMFHRRKRHAANVRARRGEQ